jgi:adenylosuccinate synthase
MRYSSVVGLQFGDEGKGSMTSYLCSQSDNPLVIRFNGGHQAGHTVLYEGIRHTFSSFGSGTLQNVPTYWSKYCTFFPIAAYNEYKALQNTVIDGKAVTPILYVDPLCPVTTPFDCIANQICDNKNGHGSVGVGFGTTIKRQEAYYKLYFQDLFNKTVLEGKLNNIRHYYENIEKIEMPNYINDSIIFWLNCIDELIANNVISKEKMLGYNELLRYNFDHIIFEGAQGILLDMDFGFFPNVTRSNTTNKNVIEFVNKYEIPTDKIDVYYMSRIYQTRHGNGYMTNQKYGELKLINNENEINLDISFQGVFKKSILDLDLINYAIQCDNNFTDNIRSKTIVITCLDQIEDNEKIQYTVNKELKVGNIKNIISNIDIKYFILGEKEGIFSERRNFLPYKSVNRFLPNLTKI